MDCFLQGLIDLVHHMAWFFNNVFKNQNPFQIKIFTDKCMMTIKVSSRIP